MRVEWRSAIIDSGGLSVMTCGTQQMLKWPVDSLATQELVCFTIACYTLCVNGGNCMLRLIMHANITLEVTYVHTYKKSGSL